MLNDYLSEEQKKLFDLLYNMVQNENPVVKETISQAIILHNLTKNHNEEANNIIEIIDYELNSIRNFTQYLLKMCDSSDRRINDIQQKLRMSPFNIIKKDNK